MAAQDAGRTVVMSAHRLSVVPVKAMPTMLTSFGDVFYDCKVIVYAHLSLISFVGSCLDFIFRM